MKYIRVSASYLFRIMIKDNYLLVKSERRNSYQPIGGCYQYFQSADERFNELDVVPEKKSNGVDSSMDIRLRVPEDSIDEFISWYKSGVDRELGYDREFEEEVVNFLSDEDKDKFKKIDTYKIKDGEFDIFYDDEKDIDSLKPMDLIGVNLTNEQLEALTKLTEYGKDNFVLATEQDIINGYKDLDNGERIKIGSYTRQILSDDNSDIIDNLL